MKFPIFLNCPSGLEQALAQELQELLPHAALQIQNAGVALSSSLQEIVLLNAQCLVASRVLLQVAQANYYQETDLYELAAKVHWEDWFSSKQTLRLWITAQRCPLKSLNFALLTVKDAICDRFRRLQNQRPDIDTRQPQVQVFIHLNAERAYLYLDTSGEPLFKRGWRLSKGEAPIKENLAAGLLRLADWRPGQALLDAFCGSGTLVIEAACRAQKKWPGMWRDYGWSQLLPFHSKWLQDWRAQQRDERPVPVSQALVGADISSDALQDARANAQRAGLGRSIQWQQQDSLRPGNQPLLQLNQGLLISNPPYQERIDLQGEVSDQAWADFGKQTRGLYPGCRLALLSPDRGLPAKLRLRESRKPVVFNGNIECRLFQFEVLAFRERAISPTGS